MKRISILLFALFLLGCKSEVDTPIKTENPNKEATPYAIVIHGGAGTMTKENYTKAKLVQYQSTLQKALDIGEKILQDGGSSLDAVEKTINFMENSPLFNAGKGAVYTNDRTHSLDASIMSGADRNAGAVGGVSIVKNPISAARAVMEKSVHVMLAGKGADQFAGEQGLEIVDPSYFYTKRSWDRINKVIARDSAKAVKQDKYGTVGCVALDNSGNIVAGTSTGGMTNKKYGRIGDSPIIGAGTYADNKSCGVSATGHGEYFIRNTVARDIAAMMEYKDAPLVEAADYIINDLLVKAGGDGGVIALDRYGNIAMPFNTSGMYRGFSKPGAREVKIFRD